MANAREWRMMIYDLYVGKDVKIQGEEISGAVSIDEAIRIIKENCGYLWGMDCPIKGKCGNGYVFKVLIEGNEFKIQAGNRFIQMLTDDEHSKRLWALVYKNGAYSHSGKSVSLGKFTPEQGINILEELPPETVLFKKEL